MTNTATTNPTDDRYSVMEYLTNGTQVEHVNIGTLASAIAWCKSEGAQRPTSVFEPVPFNAELAALESAIVENYTNWAAGSAEEFWAQADERHDMYVKVGQITGESVNQVANRLCWKEGERY